MASTRFLPDATGSTERPGLVSVLGILSFINCGIFMIIYALGMLAMAAFQRMPIDELRASMNEALEQYSGMLNEEQLAQIDEILPMLHASGALLMGLLLLRTVARFIGALGMWKGRRSGYTTYAAAQVVGIFLPHLVLPFQYLGVFGPLMAIVLCVLYGTQLKRLS